MVRGSDRGAGRVFLDASASLQEALSVGRLVGRLVRRSVMLSSKSMENGLLRILNDSESAGRGKKRDEEEGGTRRKE